MDAIYAMHSGNYFGDTLGDKWKSFKNETIGNKIRIFGQISLHTFRWADQKTRMISVFGAYRKAIADGKSESDAIKYAEEVNRRANFDYSTSDSSGLFRKLGPIGKIFLQFKKYATKEMELLFSISPTFNFLNEKFWTKENFARPEFARFMGYQTALAGLGGIPMWALMNSLWPSLLGDDPDKRIKKYLIQNMDKGPFERFVALQVMYGMFASISDPFAKGSGVDMHTRLGTSDIIPTDVKSTLLGPFFNTFAQFTKAINDNWGATGVVAPEIANTISPMLGNIGRAIRGEERSLVDKQRVTVKYDWTDRAERLLGFKPVESTLSSDTTQLVKSEQEKMKIERKKAIEIAMKLRDDGSPMTSEVANKLKEFKITPKMLDEEFKKRNQERLERVKGNLTKAQKSSSEIKGLLD
jgi:hypothetical protein